MDGIYSALLGVFDETGKPNKIGIQNLVEHNITHCGVDGLYVCGSTGENFLLPTSYKKEILKAVATQASGRIKLIAHVGSNVYEEIEELSDFALECGYDAISAVTPYYYKFNSTEIKAYYKHIADYSKLPLIIYNIPLLTSVVLSRDDFKEILNHPNIIGVKYTSSDFYLLERLRNDFPNKYIYSGFDETLLCACVLKTNGAIGSTYNIIGHWAKALRECVDLNKIEQAREIQKNMNTVIDMLCESGLYATMKEVISLYGVSCGECRAPMSPTNLTHKDMAKKIYMFIENIDKSI